jgi:hypothetical protein
MVPYAYGCCRRLIRAGAATLGVLVAVMLLGHACAQSGEPIKISQRTLMAVDCSPTMAPPWGYAQLHVLQQAVEATKTLDDTKLADYLREHVFTTVVGDVKFGAKKRMGAIVGSSGPISEHKGIRHRSIQGLVPQVVTPAEYASGEIIYP